MAAAGNPDPDAALHAAQPGKYKPADPVDLTGTGTLSDSVERLPNAAPVRATAAPVEQEQSWGDWLGSGWGDIGKTYHASETLQLGDNSGGYEAALGKGYAPILDALGLDQSENPAHFDQSRWSDKSLVRLLKGEGRNRDDQEARIAGLIRDGRAKNPKFMPGVPDDPAKLRQYVMAADAKERAAAKAAVAQAPSGLGSFVGQLGGAAAGSMADPANIVTLPIGGSGKTLLQVAAREALVNGALSAITLPAVAHNRAERGEAPLTASEAALDVAGGALGGAVLGSAFHGAGRAIDATGIPQKLGAAVGNLDLANTLSYKLYSAMPEPLQRRWGAGIVTKWARRLADGEQLEDVFSNLSNVELATLSKTVIGADRMSPEERAAAEHLTRTEEVGASSPYEPGATGDGTHESKLEEALNSIINNRPVAEVPSAPRPSDPGAAVASPAEPARPPAALSTARRPLSPALEAAKLPADIYDGLKKRGIPDHLARGIAAGTFAESRGKIDALGPVTRATHGDQAFGIGQWLGPRKAELFKRYGPSPSLDQQLDFLVHELKGGDGGGKSVLSAKDEVDALHRYITDFMRPGAGPETTKDLGRGMAALGRSGEDVGELAGGSAPLDAGPDPEIARLREDALKLDDAVIGAPGGALPPMYARSFRPDELTVDAARFQFKSGGDVAGVTDRLRGVEQWNAMHAGRVIVWEDEAGRVFLADGHQRHGLATRIEAAGGKVDMDAIVLRSADGVSADDARVYGALKNIAEGTGSMVDAAKVIRGAGDHLLAHLPPRSALVRDARALASLSDEAFGAVYNDVLPADYAAVIGHLLPDRPEAHGAMVDLLVKTDPANRGQAESIVRQGLAVGMHKAEQVDLFGEREIMQSLMIERAKVLERGLSQLRKSKLLFKTAAKEADRLEAVGSKIAKSASEKEALANAQALELVSRLAFTHGPIADALNDASRKLAGGAKLGDVADEFAAGVRGTDLGALAREAANDDANRLVPDGAGRGGDAAEAGAAVRPEQLGEQPSLTDLERATERFSDPDGAAVKQQAESLEHDLKAELAADEAFQLERNSHFLVGLHAIVDGGEEGQLGRYHWRRMHDPEGDWISVTVDGEEGDGGDDIGHLLTKGLELVSGGKVADELAGELERIVTGAKPLSRRERIKAATAALEGGKPGELRTVEPFPEEPGYHRFRYVAEDGTAVGGNYTLDDGPPPFLEGFNVGDTNNPTKLGAAEVRKLFAEIRRQHPEVTRIHAFRMTGARAVSGDGPKEIWIDLAGKGDGVKPEDVDVRAGEPVEDPQAPAPREFVERWLARDAKDRVIGNYPSEGEAKAAAGKGGSVEHDPNGVERVDPEQVVKESTVFGKNENGETIYVDPRRGPFVVTKDGKLNFGGNLAPGDLSAAEIGAYHAAIDAAATHNLDGTPREPAALDHGAQVDPALAERQRQQVALKAVSPMQSIEDQLGEIGLGLFDHADQPTFRLGEDGEEISAADLLKELEDDDKAIATLKDCL